MPEPDEPAPIGIAVVDKAAGMTSHDVVARARRVLGNRKVGHSGTLDPGATGLLLLGVGPATRLLRFLTDLAKTYTTEIVLGVETDTLDDSGAVTVSHDMAGVTPMAVAAAAADLTGDIEQIPPMVSAVRVDGRRLHELAREGKEVRREPRPVTVYRYDVEPTDDPLVYRSIVECSSGTYVRTLVADLGTALGGGAHLRELRRTRIGSFGEIEARPVDDIELLTPAEGLRDYPAVTVDEATAALVANGRVLPRQDLGVVGDGPWRILDEAGALRAVYEPRGESDTKPSVVLPVP
jgi:tRNA pseudouridine55 synthase